jgi:predicted secreted protein
MADGINGADALLFVNTGSEASPVWTAVASQRGLDLAETQATIDFSNKVSGRASRFGAGRWSATISMDSLYVPNAVTQALLRDAVRLGNEILCRLNLSGEDIEQYRGIVTDFPQSFPDQEAATISMTITLNGFPTPV